MPSASSINTSCILAMDTSTGPCSVAIWKNGALTAYIEKPQAAMQSACLIPMIEDALNQSNLTYKDITLLTTTIGPGSFTGIRVALSVVRAICFAEKIPAIGYTTLQVLGFAARAEKSHILAVLRAGKGEHYTQYFTNHPWHATTEASLGLLDKALSNTPSDQMIYSGNVSIEDKRYTRGGVSMPQADILVELAATHPDMAQDSIKPLYIRPPDAKLQIHQKIL